LGVDGCGKHILFDILAGRRRAESGEMLLEGHSYTPQNLTWGRKEGVFCIEGKSGLIGKQNIMENLYLNKSDTNGWLVNDRLMEKETKELVKSFGLPFEPFDLVRSLSPAMKTVLEIVKYHIYGAKVIVLYGVMGSSTEYELNIFLNALNRVTSDGTSILIFSNHYHHWLSRADRLIIMGALTGQFIRTYFQGSYDPSQIVSMQGGFNYTALLREKLPKGKEIFRLDSFAPRGFCGLSFVAYAGQAVGLFFEDIDKAERFAAALRGDVPHVGKLYVESEEMNFKNIRQAVRNGIGFLSATPSSQYFPALSEEDNVLQIFLPHLCSIPGILDRRKMQALRCDIREHLSFLKNKYSDLTLDNGMNAQLTQFYLYPFRVIITINTGNFDTVKTRMLFEFVEMTLKREKVVVVLSPNMDELKLLCDVVYFLE
jgi:ABC-type sugar transport system ATPase subunit